MPLKCVGCGCTEERACLGGCYWHTIEPPVCSACLEEEAGLELIAPAGHPEPGGAFFNDEYCPASPTPTLHAPLYVDETSGYCARCHVAFVL